MLIPFPLLHKLQVNSRKRWILGCRLSLPIIPIVFAIIRLVEANSNTGNVNPVKFRLFSMLENTFTIITPCLPAFRLFVVSSRTTNHSGKNSSHYYSHEGGRSFKSHESKSIFQGTKDSDILLETVIETQNADSADDDCRRAARALPTDSQEMILSSPYDARKNVLVTREFRLKRL